MTGDRERAPGAADKGATDTNDDDVLDTDDATESIDENETTPTENDVTNTDRSEQRSDADSTAMTDDNSEDTTGSRVERYVRYLLVAGLALLALIAMLRFYFAASSMIDTWITREYRSLFQALFNLAILLLAAAGISWQARKIR